MIPALAEARKNTKNAASIENSPGGTNMNENDDISGFYNDDGTKINPALISKPGLCVTCKKDDLGGMEEMLCVLTRNDQAGEKIFKCSAYASKYVK